MTTIRKTVLGVAIAALVAVLALLPAAASAAPERTVTVTAKATLTIPNDTAKIGIGVSRERKSRGAALRATSASLRKAIVAVQKVPGVGEGDVTTGRIDVRPVRKGVVLVYRATEGASVTLHEPPEAGALIAKALAAGATGVRGPSFSVGNQEEAFAKALAAAFVKAKERAAVLATQAGAKLGPALAIEEGEGAEFIGPRSTPAQAPPVAAPTVPEEKPVAPPPTKPGTSKVKATVHVVFELL